MPFVESFVTKVFYKDFSTMVSLPMLADPQAVFAMF
jgi:hypothetical protein